MNLYKSITESSWDISEDERIRMYNLIQSVYGPKWTEKQIKNINTATDEKLERLYNSALEKFKKKQATQKEVSIEDRIPTYVKDSYKEYIRNHTRTFNNKRNSEEELVKAEDNMNRSIKSFIEEYYPDLYIELWKEDLMEETNMNIYENIKKNLKESDGYVADFDEIVTQMSNASDYEDLYAAASLIQDPSIRVDVEQCIEQCEEDGDDVDVAYSVTTSDYLDMYAMQGVENTPTAEADYGVSLKKESENLDESIEQKYRKSNDNYNEFLRDVKKYTGSYDYLYGGSVSTECYEYPVTIKYFYYNRPYAGGGYNLVVNVLTPMDSMAGSEIQEAIENVFGNNAKSPLSNREIKEKILQTVKEVDAQNNLSEGNLEPQYSTRKSFYGKANVNDDNTLVSYGTPIMKIVDGKIQMLCRPEHLTQTTLRHIREFMQQNGMAPVPRNKLVKMIEEQGNINEADVIMPDEEPIPYDAVNNWVENGKKFHTVYVVGDWDDADTDAKEVAESLKKEYSDINVEYKPILEDGIWCVDIIGPYDEVYKLASTWEPLAEYPDENGGYYVEPYNESDGNNTPKQNKIPRNWKKISGEMVGDSSGGKAGDKFEITKDEYDRPIMKYANGKTYQANWSMIRSPEMVKITNVELNEGESSYSNKFSSFLNKNAKKLEREYEKDTDNEAVVDPSAKETDYTKDFLDWVERKYKKEILNESASLKESSNIIWTSETTIDDLDPEEIKEQYDIYVEHLDPDKEPMDYEDWEADWVYNSDMWDVKKEDLEENIYPMIDKQINNDILIVSGNYNSNYPDFRKSGNGGKFLNKAEDILDWLGNEDRVEILNNDGIIGVAGYDHDGSISGNLYTVPADDDLLYEIAMKTDYYNEDRTKEDVLGEFSYDVNHGNIDMSDFWGYEDKLIPIKVEW